MNLLPGRICALPARMRLLPARMRLLPARMRLLPGRIRSLPARLGLLPGRRGALPYLMRAQLQRNTTARLLPEVLVRRTIQVVAGAFSSGPL